MKNILLMSAVLITLLYSCGEKASVPTNHLKKALASQHPKIKNVIDNLSEHDIQIKYSEIFRNGDKVSFKESEFQVVAPNYFYPASTVKFPIAILTLAKLNEYDSIDRNTRFYIEGDSVITTFAKEIEKILAVSDNDAYNRLFEFLGQDYINQELGKINIGPLRISHRLSTADSDNITTKPVIVYLNDSTTTQLKGTINTIAKPLKLNNITKGKGYIFNDSLIKEPFDFSLKNYYPISTQHRFLKTVLFPTLFTDHERLQLTESQLRFVLNAMHTVPKDAGYDPEIYYDGYCKFFMYGDTKENIPDHIQIYNKVGDAYGTLLDCAYIHDSKNNIEFLLTATIHVNKNGVFNDNVYEYEALGFPFLAELGREIYKLQLEEKEVR